MTTVAITVLSVWTVAAVALCWGNHRARQAATPTPDPWLPPGRDYDTVEFPPLPPVPPSMRRLPDASPLDLHGYALDERFFGVIAPSFPEYH